MEAVNASVLLPPREPLTKEQLVVPHPSTKFDYHLNNFLASHLSNPDLTPQEIADASRSAAAAAAIAARAARATADEKAAAAAKAVAAARSALDLIASFSNQDACLGRDKNMKKHVAADLLYSKDEELPSRLQLGDVNQGIMSNSCSSCEHKNDLGMELGSDRLIESAGRDGAKEEVQVTRKRGRPKSK